ncbi:uncharacterized protein LOC122856316 [Aphidius gifuensis]|uniref:uncharacterized protein LOC122856316 n=1 Tax=Aphidius gifuensis TaxID=684658 RepID=UPI001CDD4EDA|nr:uncharacterized protein LOC122856316 [Aphidius gifuensis]
MDMDSLETLLAPHRDALRRLCETEMNWRYAQRMNRPIPPVLRRRNLVLIKYHIEAILRGLIASTMFPRLSGFQMYDDDDLDARPRFRVYNIPANEANDNSTVLEDESDLAMDELDHLIIFPSLGAKYSLIPDDRYGTTITVELCSVTYESDQEMDVNQDSDTETNEVSSTHNNDVAIKE